MIARMEFPVVGENGFAFPFPYLCGERNFGRYRCWRRSHHRGFHRTLNGRSRWSTTTRLVVTNPDESDMVLMRTLASLFRKKTRRDFDDSRCTLEEGHDRGEVTA